MEDIVKMVFSLKDDIATLINDLKEIHEKLAKVRAISSTHVSSVKNVLIDVVTDHREDLGDNLHTIIIESHELSRRIREIYEQLDRLWVVLRKLDELWVKLDVFQKFKGEQTSSE